jgi:hypothetical protein
MHCKRIDRLGELKKRQELIARIELLRFYNFPFRNNHVNSLIVTAIGNMMVYLKIEGNGNGNGGCISLCQ